MTTTEMEIGDRQEEVLRLLDTRMACLLVDRSNAEALRPQLLRLREKLAQEALEPATLDQVEALVFDPRHRDGQSTLADARGAKPAAKASRQQPPSSELVARSVAGLAGMLVLADLILRVLG